MAPAEGLNGATGGPGGQGPGSPSCPHHFMHNAWPGPPAMGEGRILRAGPGRGPRNPAPFPTGPALVEGLWGPFSCFAPFLPDLPILKKWGAEHESQTGRRADPSRGPPGGHGPPFSLRQCLEWRKATPSPGRNVGPGEGRSRRLAPARPREACSRAVSGAGWALITEDRI